MNLPPELLALISLNQTLTCCDVCNLRLTSRQFNLVCTERFYKDKVIATFNFSQLIGSSWVSMYELLIQHTNEYIPCIYEIIVEILCTPREFRSTWVNEIDNATSLPDYVGKKAIKIMRVELKNLHEKIRLDNILNSDVSEALKEDAWYHTSIMGEELIKPLMFIDAVVDFDSYNERVLSNNTNTVFEKHVSTYKRLKLFFI